MYLKSVLLGVLLCALLSPCIGQKQANWWYFQKTAGIQFSNGVPAADTNANDSIQQYFLNGFGFGVRSMASIAHSASGKLLFYGSGIGVFNKNHRSMPNGLPLTTTPYFGQSGGGGAAAEEGSLIVPRPGYPNQYYIFFLRTATALYADGNVSGMEASLIDMELDNGLGDVVSSYKSVFIIDSTEEKISATPHANGVDYWLMVRRGGTNKYHAFLITENGIANTPVTSSIGDSTNGYQSMQGNLRFNHEGDIMVHTRCCPDIMEVFDFDNATGQLSNLRSIDPITPVGWGIEFSADDSRLYIGGPVQFDVTVPTASAIAASEFPLSSTLVPFMAGLQMGPDGKIYGVAVSSSTVAPYMEVIHNPNAAGAACNHQDSAVYLEGRHGEASVPQYLSSYFITNFYADTVCVGQEASFYMNFTFIDSVLWNFGDPGSGVNNTDTALAPTHIYSDTGSYTVTLIAQNGIKSDTVMKSIYVKAPPAIDIGPDQDLCNLGNEEVVFTSGLLSEKQKAGTYLWSDGSEADTLLLTKLQILSSPTEIWLQFTNECGTDRDTALVFISKALTLHLTDTQTCADELVLTANIDSNQSPIKVFWVDASDDTISVQSLSESIGSTSIIISRLDGLMQTRSVHIKNACGIFSASASIKFLPLADGHLPGDSLHCSDIPFYVLNPQTTGVAYQWSDGSGGPQFRIDSSQQVALLSYSQCDTLTDTFDVVFVPLPQINLGGDTAICPDEVQPLRPKLAHPHPDFRFTWNTGSADSILWVNDTGKYSVTVTLNGCSVQDSMRIYKRGDCYDGCKPRLANIITPNADGINDQFGSDLDCAIENYRLQIYNRWGQIVFDTTEPSFKWDGTIAGREASEGTYFYLVFFTPLDIGKEVQYRGSISLLR